MDAMRIHIARQIGQAVKIKRKELGLTQQQLADKANVSRGFVNRVERGTATAIYPEKLLSLLEALELSLSIADKTAYPDETTHTKKTNENNNNDLTDKLLFNNYQKRVDKLKQRYLELDLPQFTQQLKLNQNLLADRNRTLRIHMQGNGDETSS